MRKRFKVGALGEREPFGELPSTGAQNPANNDKISAVRIAKAYLAGTVMKIWEPDEKTQQRRDWYFGTGGRKEKQLTHTCPFVFNSCLLRSTVMRNASLKEIGVSWGYYLSIAVFLLFAGLAIWTILDQSEKDRAIVYIWAGLFSVLALCGILWPILRIRERQGILIESVRTTELNCDAVLFPASRVKHSIGLIGSLCLGSAATAMFLFADSWEHRVKSSIGMIGFLVVFVWLLKDSFGPRHGILLRPDGVMWREAFRAPYLIPWDEIQSVSLFGKPQQYAKPSSCIGMCVRDCNRVETSSRSRKKLVSGHAAHGVHLHLEAESLLVPLTVVVVAIQFYQSHPESRRDLGTSAAAEKVNELGQLALM